MASINDVLLFSATATTWVVPEGVARIKLEAYGAEGNPAGNSGTRFGGKGGYAYGELIVKGGDTLRFICGVKPYESTPYVGGFNGGGSGGTGGTSYGGGGGGATDVRFGGSSLSHRILVAGGGGGGYKYGNGGNGGGLTGETGGGEEGGTGGTQTSGGVNESLSSLNATVSGYGANGHSSTNSSYQGGGGGGGYYGGAGGDVGTGSSNGGAGGGGSSYIGGVENGGTTSGVNSGSGYVRLTILDMDNSDLTVLSSKLPDLSTNDDVMTYEISTDRSDVTVTEIVNGVTIATKTAVNGSVLTLNIPKANWDTIKYGTNSDIKIVINDSVYHHFTFEKWLGNHSSLSDVADAVKYLSEVKLPNLKDKLRVNVSGSSTDSFEELIESATLENLGGMRWASGSRNATWLENNGTLRSSVTGLGFTPKVAIVTLETPNNSGGLMVQGFSSVSDVKFFSSTTPNVYVSNILTDGFEIITVSSNTQVTKAVKWVAFG